MMMVIYDLLNERGIMAEGFGFKVGKLACIIVTTNPQYGLQIGVLCKISNFSGTHRTALQIERMHGSCRQFAEIFGVRCT